jgi:L-rhamnose isomerase/sugar isomerase
MIQTAIIAQQLFREGGAGGSGEAQHGPARTNLVAPESCLQDACASDVRPAILEWRSHKGLRPHPLDAFHQSGYLERITRDRASKLEGNSEYA